MPLLPDGSEARFKRLKHRMSCRGMKELDLVLGTFVATLEAAGPGPVPLEALEALLDEPEPLLFEWLVLGHPCPATHAPAVALVRCAADPARKTACVGS